MKKNSVVVAAALLLLGIGVTPASAAGGPAVPDEAALRSHMTEGGIDGPTQDALIVKLASGGLPDSSTGADPIRTWTEERAGVSRTVEVFGDGSRAWVDVEQPVVIEPAGQSRKGESIGGCRAASGVGAWWYDDCRVSRKDTISEAGFVVDYKTTNLRGGLAEVRDPRGGFCKVYAGTCSAKAPSVVRGKQNGASPARAKMSYSGRLSANAMSVNGEIWLDVHRMTRTVHSTP